MTVSDISKVLDDVFEAKKVCLDSMRERPGVVQALTKVQLEFTAMFGVWEKKVMRLQQAARKAQDYICISEAVQTWNFEKCPWVSAAGPRCSPKAAMATWTSLAPAHSPAKGGPTVFLHFTPRGRNPRDLGRTPFFV